MPFKRFLCTFVSPARARTRYGSASLSAASSFFSLYSLQRLVERNFSSLSGGRKSRESLVGLHSALAGKGVIVKDKAFRNLETCELRQKGATIRESLSGFPVHVRGNVLGEASRISKSQFSKLLKQVTMHLSSVTDVYVQDAAIGSSSKCGVKVCVISDSPSAILSLSSFFWKATSRAISHDSCPLTVYVGSSISQGMVEAVGLRVQAYRGLIAADIERASLILCGDACFDASSIKEALVTLSEPVITSRGGLPLPARLLVSGDSVILLFAPDDTIQSCTDQFLSADAGVVLSSEDALPYFSSNSLGHPCVLKLPTVAVLAIADSSGTIPSLSKLSPGQAAYHFLAGYQNGKFMPSYNKGPTSVDTLELAKAFLSKLKENKISAFLINVCEGRKRLTGKDFMSLVQSALSEEVRSFQHKGSKILLPLVLFMECPFTHRLPEGNISPL